MNPIMAGVMLPVEILGLIAAISEESYRAMLSLPPFARSLSPGTIVDYMILFGHSVFIDDNRIEWCRHGHLHRLDGPAEEYSSGSKCWYQNGELHREDGPAMEYVNGSKYWYRRGKLHRLDGPAIEYISGGRRWYQNGVQISPPQ